MLLEALSKQHRLGGGGNRFLSTLSRPLKPYLFNERNSDRSPSCYWRCLSLHLLCYPLSRTYLNSVGRCESTPVDFYPLMGLPVGRANWRWVVWDRWTPQHEILRAEVPEKMVVGTQHNKPSRMNDAKEVFYWDSGVWLYEHQVPIN